MSARSKQIKSTFATNVLALVCCHLFLFSSYGQDTMTAEKVIHRFIYVSGGAKFIDQLKTTSAYAKGTINGDSVLVTIIKAVPNKIYMKFQTTSYGTIETVYNNGKSIIKRNGENIPITDSSAFEPMLASSFVLADMAYERLGYRMKLLPSEDETAFKIELISPKHQTTVKFYDKRTGYLTKVIYPDGSISFYSDYFTTNGFTLSRKEKTINKNMIESEVYITEFILNPKFDPAIFKF
jgi:hypothetical protein